MRGKYFAGKLLEAVGIAAVMLGLVQGLYGDQWGELYLWLGGIGVFLVGRGLEKSARTGSGNPGSVA